MMRIKKSSWKVDGFHRGIVKDNADPNQQGRVRVCVPVLFESIDTQYLPWAVPAMPFSFGGGAGSGAGCFCVPEVDSTVWCFFEGGDYNQPVYFAAAPDGIHGLPSERTTNYPDRRVVKTANGIVFYVDDTDKKIRITHPTGKYMEMDGSGNIVASGANVTISASGNVVINASGNIIVTADGSIVIDGATVSINP
jgi:uncharacterized protein involved in type VI secretion and phage assembly